MMMHVGCSPQQKIDSSELMQCNGPGGGEGRPLGLLYPVMVILRVSYGYGYTRGSGLVAIFGTGRVLVRVSIEYRSGS